MIELSVTFRKTELEIYITPSSISEPSDPIDEAQSAENIELAVCFPTSIVVKPSDAINEIQIPLLNASKIGSGILDPDRLPPIPVSRIVWDEGDTAIDGQAAETDSDTVPGQPLYLKANGHAALASAGEIATARVCGLALIEAAAATSTTYSADGILDLEDWTSISDAATLTPGATYFLSLDPGKLTPIAPTESGQVVIAVGVALSPSKLAIEIQQSFLL